MKQAKSGDKVSVHYKGTLADGTIFDSSQGRDPLEFTLGEKMVISGFETAVAGMKPGEVNTVNIASTEAYGPHDEKLIQEVDRSQLPPEIAPEVGQQYEAVQGEGMRLVVTVVGVSEDSVTLDANHPLAGKDLTFEIELVAIQ